MVVTTFGGANERASLLGPHEYDCIRGASQMDSPQGMREVYAASPLPMQMGGDQLGRPALPVTPSKITVPIATHAVGLGVSGECRLIAQTAELGNQAFAPSL